MDRAEELSRDPYFELAKNFNRDRPQDEIDLFFAYYDLDDDVRLYDVVDNVRDWHTMSEGYRLKNNTTIVDDLRKNSNGFGIAGLMIGGAQGFGLVSKLMDSVREPVNTFSETFINLNADMINDGVKYGGAILCAWVVSELAVRISHRLFAFSLKRDYKR